MLLKESESIIQNEMEIYLPLTSPCPLQRGTCPDAIPPLKGAGGCGKFHNLNSLVINIKV
jgi:hypothetical protein